MAVASTQKWQHGHDKERLTFRTLSTDLRAVCAQSVPDTAHRVCRVLCARSVPDTAEWVRRVLYAMLVQRIWVKSAGQYRTSHSECVGCTAVLELCQYRVWRTEGVGR
eukprot:2603568-Rhodomonas_salina.1